MSTFENLLAIRVNESIENVRGAVNAVGLSDDYM